MNTDMRILLVMLTCAIAAQVSAQQLTPLQEMVQTEQAFSKMAAEKNIRDAFMTFIADDGLLFRPGAVNGKKWMTEHPIPPSDKKPLLAWQPSYAVVAASGDMGFTTGPWEFKEDVSNDKASAYGHFVTVWKKQADGSWKFVSDLGITHPQSGGPQTLWHPNEATKNVSVKSVDQASARDALLDRDRSYSAAGLEQGLVKAFLAYASPEVRLYRPNDLPFIGRQPSADALTKAKGQFTWTPISGDVSRAGDLGYTHGTYQIMDDTKKVIEQGSYVRIWQEQHGAWRIVMDVVNQN
jgi:ketosteroid isomerase-like protein